MFIIVIIVIISLIIDVLLALLTVACQSTSAEHDMFIPCVGVRRFMTYCIS